MKRFDPALGLEIALAYERMQLFNRAALDSFRAMADDEAWQFARVSRSITIEPWRFEGQPYPGSAEMRRDVLECRHLWVFEGGNPHPCRSQEQTVRGRAVHDILGHAASGSDFSPDGELLAFIVHSPWYSLAALPALASDNLGQTAYYYFHPVNAGKPHSERVWPEQKVDLLPENLWRRFVL